MMKILIKMTKAIIFPRGASPMQLALLLCVVRAFPLAPSLSHAQQVTIAVAQVPNTAFRISLANGKPTGDYNVPTPMRIYPRGSQAPTTFTFACDDAAAGAMNTKIIKSNGPASVPVHRRVRHLL